MTQTQKILFLTHVGNPGGAEYKMIALCEALKSSSEIMHFQTGLLEDILKEKNIPSSVCLMPESLLGFKREDGLKAFPKMISGMLSMIRKIAHKEKEFDVIVCMSQKAFVLASFAKIINRKPIIWFMNDILSREHFSRPVMWLLVLLSRLSANHVVLNSQASLKAWKDAKGRTKNVSILFPGTDLEYFDAQLKDTKQIATYKEKFSPDHAPLVGVVGRLTPWKGQDVFLKAIAQIPSVHGVLIGEALFGEEEYKESLHDLVQDLKIEERIDFAGHINDIAKAIAACDIIVHCSTLPEPFGQVIVQATVAHVPVIASDAGGAQEIIENNETGQLTPIGDSQALARAIQKYLDDPKWTHKVVQKARKRAETHFSSAIMIDDFMRIVKSDL